MNKEIIKVEQLPIITERLQEIKAEVTAKVDTAVMLACTTETLASVKKARAELNKEFADFEERRKEVKKAVMQPYNQFEAVYKECITDVFKKADMALKGKINGVETTLKGEKYKEVKSYFDEYLASVNNGSMDFVKYEFERANINVTLSASVKSLKEQAKAFIDRIVEDMRLIETQEHSDEILIEYKQSLNVSSAITTVVNRHKALEEERAKAAERQQREQEIKAVENRVDEVVPPTVEAITPPKEETDDPVLTLSFKVTAPKSKLKALKAFLIDGGYKYE